MMKNKLLFFFILCCTQLSFAADFRIDAWQQTEAIWDFGIISLCDKGVPKSPIKYFASDSDFDPSVYQDIQKGDIVWIRCRFIPQFCKEVLPNVKHPFIVVISDGDESFPTDCPGSFDAETFINSEKVYHIFAQNNDYRGNSNKITHIPIGMDFHTIGYKSKEG
jgi:hypothetical protein